MLIEIKTYSNSEGQTYMHMDCYSYQTNEFQSVYNVLSNSRVEYSESTIKPDKDRRFGLRFSVLSGGIKKLENYLKIKFFDSEVTGEGDEYKCERVSTFSNETGCKTIYANDNDSASMICAIVAKKHKWFGGVAERGRCRG